MRACPAHRLQLVPCYSKACRCAAQACSPDLCRLHCAAPLLLSLRSLAPLRCAPGSATWATGSWLARSRAVTCQAIKVITHELLGRSEWRTERPAGQLRVATWGKPCHTILHCVMVSAWHPPSLRRSWRLWQAMLVGLESAVSRVQLRAARKFATVAVARPLLVQAKAECALIDRACGWCLDACALDPTALAVKCRCQQCRVLGRSLLGSSNKREASCGFFMLGLLPHRLAR